jgi:peptidoglycan hydrolase CwlO-like protein
MKSDVWKQIAIILAAILVSIVGSWVSFGRDTVTKAEVQNLIALNSPYAQDRTGIAKELQALKEQIIILQQDHETLSARLNNLAERIASLEGVVRQLERNTTYQGSN